MRFPKEHPDSPGSAPPPPAPGGRVGPHVRAWSVPRAGGFASCHLAGHPATCPAWGMSEEIPAVSETRGSGGRPSPHGLPSLPRPSGSSPRPQAKVEIPPWPVVFTVTACSVPSGAQMTGLADLSHEHFRPLCGVTGLPVRPLKARLTS